jgi:DnaJ-class molecular chaperone
MRQHYIKELKIPKTIKEAREVLGISGKPTQKKISKVHKKLSLMYHPDKQSDCDKNSKDLANTNAKALNLAKDLLINALENKTKYNRKACSKGESETSRMKCDEQDVKPNIANSFINKNLERAKKLI